MNNQTGINDTALIKSIFYMVVGSTWTRDSIYLLLVTPMGILGVILNSVLFGVFISKHFRSQPLFQYLQVYAFNSLILSATLACSFLISPRFLFNLSISSAARIFKCYLVPSAVVSLFFYFNNALDVVINIQSSLAYTDKFNRFKSINPYIMCAVIFFVCFLFNSPYYILVIASTDEQVNSALSSVANIINFKGLCLRNPEFYTNYGYAISLFGLIAKELVTLCLEILSSLSSIICMKLYYNRYRELTQKNPNQTTLERISKDEKRKTLMSLTLTVLSMFIHFFNFSVLLIIFFLSSSMSFDLTLSIYVLISFKQLINFPLFFLFNKKFRAVYGFKKIISDEIVVRENTVLN